MELNITEIDNINTMNPYDTFNYDEIEQNNLSNYWEKSAKTETKEKRKKVSFNDILSNMNLVVNKQGVLQLMVPNQQEISQQNEYQCQYYADEFSQQQNIKNNSYD
jgi:hypothetical protein